MKLLLDTHIWVWSLTRPSLLGAGVKKQLESSKNQLFVSPVSIWEVGHLERKRKLKFADGLGPGLEQMLRRMPLNEAPFNFAVAAQACAIRLPQGDPGDVFLAATALVFDMTLVTADSQLLGCEWLKTLPND